MSQLLKFYKSFNQPRTPAPKAAPTFEDLTIDDNLSEQQRVIRYTKSTIGLQRLVHLKKMADVASSIGFDETLATIIPLVEPLSKDVEPVVKQHLVEQVKYLAKYCKEFGGVVGYKVILEQLLPIIAHMLEEEKPEVRHAASTSLVEVAQLITLDDIGQFVLTIILRLAHEDEKEDMRMTASQLLNLLAEALGYDLCRQFVIPEVVSLAEDPAFRVRKSTALNFHLICKVGGEHELLERLMPAFVRLSKDDMYRVRRACAESLFEISKNVSEDVRLGVLLEIFLRLAQDPSKLVKQSVLQQAGMFISTLPARALNDNILSHFSSMASSPTGDASVDIELKYYCAYSFPAVLERIGAKRWGEVKQLYHSLTQSRAVNIKRTLAYSLHEVACILGDGFLVESELVSVFEEMIQDSEAIQMGVITHLARFLERLPKLCRVSYLPLLHDILHTTNPFNWRLRKHLACQLPDLAVLPPKEDLYRTLFPTVMILLQDPVASVRRYTFKGVTSLINILHDASGATLTDDDTNPTSSDASLVQTYKQNLEDVISALNSFAIGDKYQLRQLWCELCIQLLRDLPRPLFEDNFIEGILSLTLDRVANVRIALSEFLCGWGDDVLPPWVEEQSARARDEELQTKRASPWHWLLRRVDIKQCVERLSKDDPDVFLNVSKLSHLYPDHKFVSISCRGRKIPPGGNVPISLNASPMVIGQDLRYVEDVDPSANNSAFISEDTSSASYSLEDNMKRIAVVHTEINTHATLSGKRRPSVAVDVVDISHSSGGVATKPAFPVLHADNTILADEVDLLDDTVEYLSLNALSDLKLPTKYDDDEDEYDLQAGKEGTEAATVPPSISTDVIGSEANIHDAVLSDSPSAVASAYPSDDSSSRVVDAAQM